MHYHYWVGINTRTYLYMNYTGAKMVAMQMRRGQLDKGRYHASVNKTSPPSCTLVLDPQSNEIRTLTTKFVCVCVCV